MVPCRNLIGPRQSTWMERCTVAGRRRPGDSARNYIIVNVPTAQCTKTCPEGRIIFPSLPTSFPPSSFVLSTKQVTATPNPTRAPTHKSLACFFLPTSLPYLCSHSSSQAKCLPSAPISNYPMRNGTTRCELCKCYISIAELSQHQNGKRHRRNVASAGPAELFQHQNGKRHRRNVASTGPQQSDPSQMTSIIQSAPPANIPPLSNCDMDPRVHVSGEGGLDFSAEGSGTSGNPVFFSTTRNILIKKTNLPSGDLFLQSLALEPAQGSWCELLWPLYS